MNTRRDWLALGCAAALSACATTYGPATTTSGGEVALGPDSSAGYWIDYSGGTWMDSSGVMHIGARTGMATGLLPSDVTSMTTANIFAHLSSGDSLEIMLSRQGEQRARDAVVRTFARRMIDEHGAHLENSMRLASQNGVMPATAASDTTDTRLGARLLSRISGPSAGSNFDRDFMMAEVMMHRHMLHELTMLRPQAGGPALELIDQTARVVRQHLTDAETLWRQMGGRWRQS
jgi:putative membrane protein